VTRIEVVIDELVLIGFDPGDRHRIGLAVEREVRSQSFAQARHALAVPERLSPSSGDRTAGVADAFKVALVSATRRAVASDQGHRDLGADGR